MVTAITDTAIIVDLLRDYMSAIAWYEAQALTSLGITPIIWMEVIEGAPTKVRRLNAARLLRRFEMVYLTEADLEWAMEAQMRYELSHGVGMIACLIASVRQRLQIPLYTHNLKHFTPLLGNFAQKPY